jgi:hypothetical protein
MDCRLDDFPGSDRVIDLFGWQAVLDGVSIRSYVYARWPLYTGYSWNLSLGWDTRADFRRGCPGDDRCSPITRPNNAAFQRVYSYEHLIFEIVAHRVATEFFPENSEPAYEQALALGAEAIVLNVHLAADGVLVVYHYVSLADSQ